MKVFELGKKQTEQKRTKLNLTKSEQTDLALKDQAVAQPDLLTLLMEVSGKNVYP